MQPELSTHSGGSPCLYELVATSLRLFLLVRKHRLFACLYPCYIRGADLTEFARSPIVFLVRSRIPSLAFLARDRHKRGNDLDRKLHLPVVLGPLVQLENNH